eukprot:9607309-Lingulodinium_polyedra.AAC.1
MRGGNVKTTPATGGYAAHRRWPTGESNAAGWTPRRRPPPRPNPRQPDNLAADTNGRLLFHEGQLC